MAMASCVLSSSFSSLALAPVASTSASTGVSNGLQSFDSSSFSGARLAIPLLSSVKLYRLRSIARTKVAVKAAAEDGAGAEAVAEPAAEAPANPISEMKLQSDLLKKIAKKAELKRKRLVRKRHLRKKGRWPPSKLKKGKNV